MKHIKNLGVVAASLAAVVVLLGQPAPAQAATVPVANAAAIQTQREAGSLVADKIALKELVDTFPSWPIKRMASPRNRFSPRMPS